MRPSRPFASSGSSRGCSSESVNGDLAVVEVRGEARGERLGRHVGEVGLVEVDPEERLGAALRGQPAPRRFHGRAPRPLLHEERGAALGVAEPVVVDVEPAVEAEARVEGERAHEGAGAIAGLAQERGQGVGVRREAEARVVADAVVERVAAGEDVRVRGQRHHVLGVGLLEAHARRGQPVHPGRRDVGWP